MVINKEKVYRMKENVYHANLDLKKNNLITLTWGNVSEVDREDGLVVIKPSGVPYDKMKEKQMVVTDLEGNKLEDNSLNPSSDLATHLYLYKHFNQINSIVHTHSTFAVIWAQAGRDIPPYGTTHADTFYGAIPVTRQLIEKEVTDAYELNTGKVIVECFNSKNINPASVPGVITSSHGPFTWGNSCQEAVNNSIVLDEVAHMALFTEQINTNREEIPQYLLDKHYFRKHGADAYYGQTD